MSNTQKISVNELAVLHDYIHELCGKRGMSLELHWGCFGDENKFYSYAEDKYFSVDTNTFPYVGRTGKLEELQSNIYFFVIEHTHRRPQGANRCVIYIEDIFIENDHYTAIMGCKMFVDKSVI